MFEKIVAQLPSEICREFRLALDCGYWGSGLALTKEQRRICELALFYHESNNTAVDH